MAALYTVTSYPTTGTSYVTYNTATKKLAYVAAYREGSAHSGLWSDTAETVLAFFTNPVLNDDFTGYTTQANADLAWVSTDTTKDRVNITNDNCDFNHNINNGNVGIAYDLGVTTSDTLWVLRFKLRFSTLTQAAGAFLYMGLSDETQASDDDNVQDFIGLLMKNISGTTNYGSLDTDGAAPAAVANDNNSTSVTWAISTDYFVEIKRTGATTYTVAVYSDSGFSTVLGGGPISGTVAATTTALRYIRLFNGTVAAAGVFTGTMDDVQFKNGVSTY